MRKLSILIAGYEAKDVHNGDETGLLFKGVPIESLALNRK